MGSAQLRLIAVALVASAALPRLPLAKPVVELEVPTEQAFSWAGVVGEGPSGYDEAMRAGDLHTTVAVRDRRGRLSGRVARAIRAYETAASLRPEAPEPHYRLAQLYYSFYIARIDRRVPDAGKTQKALKHWQHFERLAPRDPRLPDVLFQKSLALTKQANAQGFREAVAVYTQLLSISSPDSLDPNTISIYLGNNAELHMMLGDLDQSIELYQQALAYGNRSWLGYGLAVALDRDGQGTKARQIMQTNLYNDTNMRRLSQDGTFFVPEGEKNYYLALGYDVLGDTARAVRYYRAFIKSGAHPRFHARAALHLRRLEGRRSPRRRTPPRTTGLRN